MLNQLASIKLLASQKWKPEKLVFLFSFWDQFNQIMVFHFFRTILGNWEFHSKSDESRVISRSRQKKFFKGKVFRAGTKKKVISKNCYFKRTPTAWKVSKYGVISLHKVTMKNANFFAQSYISPYSVQMRENTDQKQIRILDTFYAVTSSGSFKRYISKEKT